MGQTKTWIGLHQDHNAGIAAVRDGELTLYCELERLTREKNQAGWFPDIIEQTLRTIDLDSIGGLCVPRPARMSGWLAERVGIRGVPIHGQDDLHPLLHILAALTLQEVRPAMYAVLVFDAEQPRMGWLDLREPLRAVPDLHLRPMSSDGWFNGELFSDFYGKVFYGSRDLRHCGKLMGLASWGRTRLEYTSTLRETADRHFDRTTRVWEGYLGSDGAAIYRDICRATGGDPHDHRSEIALDLAASAQELFTDELVRQARRGAAGIAEELRQQGLPEFEGLLYGGGCALSVIANSALRQALGAPVIIPPFAHDASQFVGAAIYASLMAGEEWPLGRGWRTVPAHTVGTIDAEAVARMPSSAPATPAEIARRVLSGEIIAVARGGAEAGPRALGHRTLLANALDLSMRERINDDVKKREWYRPFAPMILADAFRDYFAEPASPASRYMLDSYRFRPEHRPRFASVSSPDGVSRPQAIDGSDRFLFDVLHELGARSGHPVVLNTSLNAPGCPIAFDLRQVIDDCNMLGVDAAVLDGILFEREHLREAADAMKGAAA